MTATPHANAGTPVAAVAHHIEDTLNATLPPTRKVFRDVAVFGRLATGGIGRLGVWDVLAVSEHGAAVFLIDPDEHTPPDNHLALCAAVFNSIEPDSVLHTGGTLVLPSCGGMRITHLWLTSPSHNTTATITAEIGHPADVAFFVVTTEDAPTPAFAGCRYAPPSIPTRQLLAGDPLRGRVLHELKWC